MTRRSVTRRIRAGFSWDRDPWIAGELVRTEPDRRVAGEADRRKEIHAELAELYKRRCDDCTPTCIHQQQEDAEANR